MNHEEKAHLRHLSMSDSSILRSAVFNDYSFNNDLSGSIYDMTQSQRQFLLKQAKLLPSQGDDGSDVTDELNTDDGFTDLEWYATAKLEKLLSNGHVLGCIIDPFAVAPENLMACEERDPTQPFGQDYARDPDGKLEYTDSSMLAKQRGVFTHMVKQIGANLFLGKSIMQISLPVDIFGNHSTIQRCALFLVFAPLFLEKAALLNHDPLEQMKLAICYLTSRNHLQVEQRKPFNPILGETFQGHIAGCPFYYEQISHHPPVFAFQYYGNNYNIDGKLEMAAKASANSMKGKILGLERITFPGSKNCIYLRIPTCLVEGLACGKRVITYTSKGIFFDPVNRLYAKLMFDPDKTSAFNIFSKRKFAHDVVMGDIYEVTKEFAAQTLEKIQKKGDTKLKITPQDIVKTVSKIQGSWLDHLLIDGKEYWNIRTLRPYKIVESPNPLPSDASYREDMLHLMKSDITKAQKAKVEMEDLQRKDHKLRKGKNH